MNSINPVKLQQILDVGLKKLNMQLPEIACKKLIDYISLLQKWNAVYNLTAVRDAETMMRRHILESLTLAPYISRSDVLDAGTGAGLPGIPLAIALPNLAFTLLDSCGKKIRFINHVIMQLKINNITTIQERLEKFRPANCFNTIVTRATFSLNDIIQNTKHLLCANGELLVMKGLYPQGELHDITAAIKHDYKIITHEANMLDPKKQRHIVIIKNIKAENNSD